MGKSIVLGRVRRSSESLSSSAMLRLIWTHSSRALLIFPFLLWSSKQEQKVPLTETSRTLLGSKPGCPLHFWHKSPYGESWKLVSNHHQPQQPGPAVKQPLYEPLPLWKFCLYLFSHTHKKKPTSMWVQMACTKKIFWGTAQIETAFDAWTETKNCICSSTTGPSWWFLAPVQFIPTIIPRQFLQRKETGISLALSLPRNICTLSSYSAG